MELTHLDLSFNPMTYLVEESVSMPKLTHLSLNHMALQDLSELALSLSPFVSYVDLSFNQLPYILALTGSLRLTSLNLTGNHEYSIASVFYIYSYQHHCFDSEGPIYSSLITILTVCLGFFLQSTNAAQMEIITIPKIYCLDLSWDGNIEIGPLGTKNPCCIMFFFHFNCCDSEEYVIY